MLIGQAADTISEGLRDTPNTLDYPQSLEASWGLEQLAP